MSDSHSEPPRKNTDRRGAKLNLKRAADSRVNEEDLWNFDEASAPAAEAGAGQPETDDAPTDPPAETVAPLAEAPAAPDSEEPITRIEPTYSKRRLRRNQRRQVNQSTDEGDAFEELATTAPPREEPLPLTREPQVTAAAEITPSTPVGLGLNEDELWGDFLDDEDSPTTPPVPQEAAEAVAAESPTLPETPVLPPPPEPEEEKTPEPAAIGSIESSSMAEELSQKAPEREMFDDPSADDSPAVDTAAREEPKKIELSWKSLQLSRLEMIASGVFLGLLCLLGLWAMSAFRSQVLAQEDPYRRPDFPVAGSLAKVEFAETYWRKPVREGENADVVRREITLIPVIDVTLGADTAPSGVIRVMFYNDKGEIAGDTITRSFRNQQFTASASNRISFSSTSGFTDYGEQEAYRAHIVKPWSINVYEGPDENAPSSAFKLLFSIPISTNIQ